MKTENIFLDLIDTYTQNEKIRALSSNHEFKRLKKSKFVKKLM